MSIKKIIGGICGLVLGISCLNLSNVKAEDAMPCNFTKTF